jgi:hypothetical protein
MTNARSITRAVIVLAALAGAACAAARTGGAASAPTTGSAEGAAERGPPSAASEIDLRVIADAERAIEVREVELATAAAEEAPVCARACALGADICGLAERICVIAARYPADDPVRAMCTDGRVRCVRARAAIKGRCTCAPAGP